MRKTPPSIILSLLFLTACTDQSVPENTSDTEQTAISATTSGGTTGSQNSTFNDDFMDLVNAHRSSIGLRALINDEDISAIAQKHSDDMANGSVPFGHDGFAGRCSDARKAMGNSNACGENVALGQKTPQAVFNSWLNSAGHRTNIEKAAYTHSGFGYKKSSNGTYYWTHLFLQVN